MSAAFFGLHSPPSRDLAAIGSKVPGELTTAPDRAALVAAPSVCSLRPTEPKGSNR